MPSPSIPSRLLKKGGPFIEEGREFPFYSKSSPKAGATIIVALTPYTCSFLSQDDFRLDRNPSRAYPCVGIFLVGAGIPATMQILCISLQGCQL